MDLAHVDLAEGSRIQAAILTAIAGDERPFAALTIGGGARFASAVALRLG